VVSAASGAYNRLQVSNLITLLWAIAAYFWVGLLIFAVVALNGLLFGGFSLEGSLPLIWFGPLVLLSLPFIFLFSWLQDIWTIRGTSDFYIMLGVTVFGLLMLLSRRYVRRYPEYWRGLFRPVKTPAQLKADREAWNSREYMREFKRGQRQAAWAKRSKLYRFMTSGGAFLIFLGLVVLWFLFSLLI